MITIATNTVVALRYIMRNSTGHVLEDTMNATPVNYLQGAAGILPLLQVQLEGLRAGDKKIVHLLKENGLTDNDFIFEVIIDEVRAASPEEIILGYPLKPAVTKCEAKCDCYT